MKRKGWVSERSLIFSFSFFFFLEKYVHCSTTTVHDCRKSEVWGKRWKDGIQSGPKANPGVKNKDNRREEEWRRARKQRGVRGGVSSSDRALVLYIFCMQKSYCKPVRLRNKKKEKHSAKWWSRGEKRPGESEKEQMEARSAEARKKRTSQKRVACTANTHRHTHIQVQLN